MKEINSTELKQIQMGILDVIHDFCQKNQIKYSLACGTLIGAIRHKGFIPWDDDIDLYMLREDYERFLKIFPREGSEFVVSAVDFNKNHYYPFAKVHNTKTILKEFANYDAGLGVNIDIFPLDNIPENKFVRLVFYKILHMLGRISVLKNVKIKKDRAMWKNLILFFGRLTFLFLPMSWLCRAQNFVSKIFAGVRTKQIAEATATVGQRARFDREHFDDVILASFEGKCYCVMKGYDTYLRNFYGDYMQLPPEDKRVTHHNFKAYWKD